MIELIPAIDIIDGRCVRLTKGDYATERVYSEQPVDMAKAFEDFGFRRLHVVDLDGARSSHIVNHRVVEQIVAQTGLQVDFGGGVKTDEDVQRAFDFGARWVTVGSLAVTRPDVFLDWLARYGADRLILGADVRDGRVSINGWKDDSGRELLDFLADYWSHGVEQVLCTEISKDGMLSGPATALYARILRQNPQCYLIASGGVSSDDDIRALDAAGLPAVVFGKAIYEGRVDLKALSREFILSPKVQTPSHTPQTC